MVEGMLRYVAGFEQHRQRPAARAPVFGTGRIHSVELLPRELPDDRGQYIFADKPSFRPRRRTWSRSPSPPPPTPADFEVEPSRASFFLTKPEATIRERR
jgi:hypothetical protein